VNAEKKKNMFTSEEENAGKRHNTKRGKKFFGNVAKFKCVGKDQNCFLDGIRRR
jgi:hypothetical protein